MKRLFLCTILAIPSCGEKEKPPKLTERGKQIASYRPPVPEENRDDGDAKDTIPSNPQLPNSQYFPLTEKLHEFISGKTGESSHFAPYAESVPLAGDATFELVPVPGGEFSIGTPGSEAGHLVDESPQVELRIEPFWIGRYEVTWEIYRAFMENDSDRNRDGSLNRDSNPLTPEAFEIRDGENLVDAVPQPPPPPTAMHYEMGQGYLPGWPAIAMTQHAASMFCEWLSAQTGHFYRLPTEVEWEYACRAGTTTAYSFGDDPAQLDSFAWTIDNCDYSYQMVGQKKPNPWGIHDMHGNVAEWCLDAYRPDAYAAWQFGSSNPWHPATARYPRVVRGGSYHDANPALTMRSGARIASKPSWKALDWQKPESIWYFTSNQWIGFRVVRPLAIPDVRSMHLMWNTGPGEQAPTASK